MQKYKIEPINKADAYTINKTLIKELKDKKLFKNIIMHIRKGTALKLLHDGEIAGFCLMKEFEQHFSLSYYYIYPKFRRKHCSLFFFSYCAEKMKDKPIFVQKNKNYEMYKKYFKTTLDKDIIIFDGLRKESEWEELLKK